MQTVLILTLALHVLAGVFWAGSTFTLAHQQNGAHAERLFALQRGAAVIVIVTGALLWYFLHGAAFGSPEVVLAVGIGAAIAAAGVQDASVGSARRKLANADTQRKRDCALAWPLARGLRPASWRSQSSAWRWRGSSETDLLNSGVKASQTCPHRPPLLGELQVAGPSQPLLGLR